MAEWRKYRTVAAAGVALFVVLQLAVPISRLGDGNQTERFGWQMFSRVGDPIDFTVHTSTGSLVIDLEQVMARTRADIPLEALLPPHRCNTVDGAESVTWDDKGYECSPG